MFTYNTVCLANSCHYIVVFLNLSGMFVGKWVDMFIYCPPWMAVVAMVATQHILDLDDCSLSCNAILIIGATIVV